MAEKRKPAVSRSQRLSAHRIELPNWFGWLAVAAMFLLPVTRVDFAETWRVPLLSLGEWLLLPLGVASLSTGLLDLPKIRERTLLPLWLSAMTPAALWLGAVGLAILGSTFSQTSGDLLLAWVSRLLFPVMAFLPLLVRPIWRDRLFQALGAGVFIMVLVVMWQLRSAGLAASDPERLNFGGFLANQYDYGVYMAVALPLLAGWMGGGMARHRLLVMLVTMFLLPGLALAASQTWAGIFAGLIGLAVCWTAWRKHAWILGVFVCLLVFGQGTESGRERERLHREQLVATLDLGTDHLKSASQAFVARPFLGYGPESFLTPAETPPAVAEPRAWYASLLGGSGLVGLGMWLALLAELAARALGRDNRRALFRGGVLGGAAGLAAAGWWCDVLPAGAGALVGFLLALSVVEDPEAAAESGRRSGRHRDGEAVSKRTSARRKAETPAAQAQTAPAQEGEAGSPMAVVPPGSEVGASGIALREPRANDEETQVMD